MSKKKQVEFKISVEVLDYERHTLGSRTMRLIVPIGGAELEDTMAALNVYDEEVQRLAAKTAGMAVFKASEPISEAMKLKSEQEHAKRPELPDPGEGKPAAEAAGVTPEEILSTGAEN